MGRVGRSETWAQRPSLSMSEAASLLDCSPSMVRRWCDAGVLRSYRLPGSKHRRISRENLVRFARDNGLPVYQQENNHD